MRASTTAEGGGSNSVATPATPALRLNRSRGNRLSSVALREEKKAAAAGGG